MTQLNRHRIQRQLIELVIRSDLSGPAVQESLARSYWDHLAPTLSSVFDEVASADELLRLDRLEIDLGTIAGADWEPQFRRRLVSELTQRLGAYVAESANRENTAPTAGVAHEPMRLFIFFLEHGRLPWWGERPATDWNELLSKRPVAPEWQVLHAALLAEPRARARCVDALSDEMLAIAVAAWCGLADSALVLERLTPESQPQAGARGWRRRFWQIVIDWALSGRQGPARGAELMRALLEARRAHALPQSWRDSAARAAAQHSREPSDGLARAELPSPWREWLSRVGGLAPEPSVTGDAAASAATREHPKIPLAVDYPTDLERSHELPEDAQPVYLPCAGAVLLHPFLGALFRDRGLLEGRDFRDVVARQRGVHLLGYLGFGRVEVPEYDLPIAKILCGFPLEEPLDPALLDADDLAACDALLNAVLGHWSALRSSSGEWLRTQFLLRDGKLEALDSGFRLTVERRAQDVLLTRIPWGFGVISMPWMPERIFVHWLD